MISDTMLFKTLNQQELYEFLIEAKNEWNRRFETQPPTSYTDPMLIGKNRMKKAYLNFGEPESGRPV